MKKLNILCIIGASGSGKTMASLYLKDHKGANVICSYTTRQARENEVEGRDHYFVSNVPDHDEMIAYALFGNAEYFALKSQVHGPCTVYVIDEQGLDNLRAHFSDRFQIHTLLIKRDVSLRKASGIDDLRIQRDNRRCLIDKEYDYVINNNGTETELFDQIGRIYEHIKNNRHL